MPRARVATWSWATSCASGGLRPIGDLGELQRKGDADRVRDVAGAAVDVNDGEEEEGEEEEEEEEDEDEGAEVVGDGRRRKEDKKDG